MTSPESFTPQPESAPNFDRYAKQLGAAVKDYNKNMTTIAADHSTVVENWGFQDYQDSIHEFRQDLNFPSQRIEHKTNRFFTKIDGLIESFSSQCESGLSDNDRHIFSVISQEDDLSILNPQIKRLPSVVQDMQSFKSALDKIIWDRIKEPLSEPSEVNKIRGLALGASAGEVRQAMLAALDKFIWAGAEQMADQNPEIPWQFIEFASGPEAKRAMRSALDKYVFQSAEAKSKQSELKDYELTQVLRGASTMEISAKMRKILNGSWLTARLQHQAYVSQRNSQESAWSLFSNLGLGNGFFVEPERRPQADDPFVQLVEGYAVDNHRWLLQNREVVENSIREIVKLREAAKQSGQKLTDIGILWHFHRLNDKSDSTEIKDSDRDTLAVVMAFMGGDRKGKLPF